MTPLEFAEQWYKRTKIKLKLQKTIPKDVCSDEFGDWLCSQLRLAMSRGIVVGQNWEDRKKMVKR